MKRSPSTPFTVYHKGLNGVYSSLWETHRRATERHLPYGIGGKRGATNLQRSCSLSHAFVSTAVKQNKLF